MSKLSQIYFGMELLKDIYKAEENKKDVREYNTVLPYAIDLMRQGTKELMHNNRKEWDFKDTDKKRTFDGE